MPGKCNQVVKHLMCCSSSVNWSGLDILLCTNNLYLFYQGIYLLTFMYFCMFYLFLLSSVYFFINLWNINYCPKICNNIQNVLRKLEVLEVTILKGFSTLSFHFYIYIHTRKPFIVRKLIRIRWERNVHIYMPSFITLLTHQ